MDSVFYYELGEVSFGYPGPHGKYMKKPNNIRVYAKTIILLAPNLK